MNTCTGCLGLTLSNSYGPGFCPLGHQVVKEGHIKRPKEECPRPKTHADMIAIQQDNEDE